MADRFRHHLAPVRADDGSPLQHALSLLRPVRTERLLCDLIDIFSPSLQEHAIIDYCQRYLQEHGVTVQRIPVGETRRFNLLARTGPQPIGLLLLGHVDTVQKWHQREFRHRREGELITGLGSADMKAGCAAMMEAFIALQQSQALLPDASLPSAPESRVEGQGAGQAGDPTSRRAIALALVVGEESSGDGSSALMAQLQAQGEQPQVAVIGEPTRLNLCYRHFGYLEVLLTTHGKRAHAALPERGDNAIDAMMQLLGGLRAPVSSLSQIPGNLLESLVFNVREMRGGGEAFVVPEYCEAVLDVHFPPDVSLQSVKGLLHARMRREREHLPRHRCHMHQKFGSDGYALSAESDAMRYLLWAQQAVGAMPLPIPEEPDIQQGVFRSHSDGNVLWAQGTRPVVIGPGDLHTAHTLHERVSVRELQQATQLYVALGIRYWLSEGTSHQKVPEINGEYRDR